MRDKLIAAGVKNLREFGYPECDASNILTDYVYASFFVRMLHDSKCRRPDVDEAIDELLAECQKAINKGVQAAVVTNSVKKGKYGR